MYTTLIDCTCTFLRCYIPTLLVCYLHVRCLYVVAYCSYKYAMLVTDKIPSILLLRWSSQTIPHGGSGVPLNKRMAQLQLKTLESFNFGNPDDWPRWKRRFEQFRIASGLGTSTDIQQVSTLLYCIGEEAKTVLDSTGVTEEEWKQYATVLGKFDEHFKVRQNTIFERACFNRRYQQERESAEAYITELYRQSENCKYGDLKEMIRDRLIVGVRNQALSQQLQMDPELTLERAKKRI